MRKEYNPHKDQLLEKSEFIHQVVMPVYIPNQEDYFIDSLSILKLSLESLFKTTHKKTFFSIINNGSCQIVVNYLEELRREGQIHELIHTSNIGKLNAILKGLVGNNIELVTITDADVLFSSHWQLETSKVFKTFHKVGVVGIVPQFNMFKYHCGNVIFDNLFNKKLGFIPVKNPNAIINFYKSIGWDDSYNDDLLKYSLGLELDDMKVYIGSGHFVATYKKQMFQNMTAYIGYKLGGGSESYLDTFALKYDYWRVTTHDNYAYHMGNEYEDWMSQIKFENVDESTIVSKFEVQKTLHPFLGFLKNKVFMKFLRHPTISKWFYKWKKLPKGIIENYNNLVKK